ncbi:hypothetical protein BgiBS90_011705 [Biomphalaria glabrata]|nr:hypothetical protein BgiBS90_011705 [Biomphalaria glabrata]
MMLNTVSKYWKTYYSLYALQCAVIQQNAAGEPFDNYTSQQDVDLDLNRFTFENLDLSSCYNLCYQWRIIPCSCDVKCPVLGNCCEDFTSECPETFRESQTIFNQFSTAKVKCERNTLMISACPDNGNTSRGSATSGETLDKYRTFREVNFSNNVNNTFFDKVIKTLHVTDLFTGFTYVNSEVFTCYAESRSEPVIWDIVLSSGVNGFNLNDKYLNTSLFLPKNMMFKPPAFLKNRIKFATCFLHSVSKCPEDVGEDSRLVKSCSSFYSFVKFQETVFNNHYCALCNGFNTSHALEKSDVLELFYYNDFIFSVTVSFESSRLVVTQKEPNSNSFLSDWLKIECSLNKPFGFENLFPCQLQSCSNFGHIIDGQCKDSMILLFAFPVADFPVSEHESLWNYIRCYLYERLQLRVQESKQFPSLEDFKLRKKKFIIFTFQMFLTYSEKFFIAEIWRESYFQDIVSLTSSVFTIMKYLKGARLNMRFPLKKTAIDYSITQVCFGIFRENNLITDEQVSNSDISCTDVRINESYLLDKKESMMNLTCGEYLISSEGSFLITSHLLTLTFYIFRFFCLKYM